MAENILKVEEPITVEQAVLARKVYERPHENSLIKIINELIVLNFNTQENKSGFYFEDAVYRMVEAGLVTPDNPTSRVLDAGSFYIPECFRKIWDVDDSQIFTGGCISFCPKKTD